MKKIVMPLILCIIVTFAFASCGFLDESSENNKEQKKQSTEDKKSSKLKIEDTNDLEFIKFKGHPRIGDEDDLIDEVYKGDDRVALDDSSYKKLITFGIVAFRVQSVRINGKILENKLSLDESLELAKSYLPEGFSSDYKFFDSGIEDYNKDGIKQYDVFYEGYRDNICVAVSMKGDEMQLLEIISRDTNFYDDQERFTEEWDYKF